MLVCRDRTVLFLQVFETYMCFHMFWFDFVGERSQITQEFAIEPVCVVENKYVEGLVRRHKTMRPLPVSIEEALFKNISEEVIVKQSVVILLVLQTHFCTSHSRSKR